MATTTGFAWSPADSPPNQPEDITSPVYPDRVIRPLPKRPIKSRLSSEQANAIVYPPVPPSSSPVFGSPYGQSGPNDTNQVYSPSDADLHSPHDHDHVCGCGEDHSEGESDLDAEDYGSVAQRYFEPSSMQRFPRSSRATRAAPPKSSTSSADGYESFENTNNKKKRKIPVSGAGSYISSIVTDQPSVGAAQLNEVGLSERRSMATSHQEGRSLSSFYSDRSDTGLSAAARGRYQRTSNRMNNQRQPLGPSPSSISNYQSSVPHRFKATGVSSDFQAEQSNRITSNLNSAERQVSTTGKEKENFTFNAPSESSKKMGLVPEAGLPAGPSIPQLHGAIPHAKATSGIQKSSNTPLSANTLPTAPSLSRDYQASGKAQPPPESEEAIRRNHRRELRLQMRQRRLQVESNTFHNPPSPEDVWVCEFCEYEAVFGQPPKHIIRQFEETQLKKQKQADDHKRLLEKAKKTNKKNRKAKSHPKHGAVSTAHPHSQTRTNDSQYNDAADHDLDGQSDDLFEPSYDDTPLLSNQQTSIDGSHFETLSPDLTTPGLDPTGSGGSGGSNIGVGGSRIEGLSRFG